MGLDGRVGSIVSREIMNATEDGTTTGVGSVQQFFEEMWNTIVLFFQQDAAGLLLKIFLAIVFLILIRYGIKLSNWLIYRSLSRVRKSKKKGVRHEPMDVSIIYFIQGIFKFVVLTVVLFVILGMFGVDFTSLGTILAGAVAGITLSLQSLVSNFAYGVVIISSKMVKTGDYIYGSGFEGTIKSISMLFTTLETVDGMKVIVPNTIMATNPLQDETSAPIRNLRVNFRVVSTADIPLLRKQLTEEAKKDPRVLQDQPVSLLVTNLSETSLGLSLRVYVKNDDFWSTMFALNEVVANTLVKNKYALSSSNLSINTLDGEDKRTVEPSKNPKLPFSKEEDDEE